MRAVLQCIGLAAAATGLTASGDVGTAAAVFAGGLASGVAGNLATDAWKALERRGVEAFLVGRRGVDENHVVAQALRHAQIVALRPVAKRFRAGWETSDDPAWRGAMAQSDALEAFLDEAQREASGGAVLARLAGDADDDRVCAAAVAVLPEVVEAGLAERRAGPEIAGKRRVAWDHARSVAEAAVLAELTLRVFPGATAPEPFLRAFRGEDGGEAWFDLFLREAAARLRDKPDVAAIWQAEAAATLRALAEHHGQVLSEIKADTAALLANTDAMQAKLDAILARLPPEDAKGVPEVAIIEFVRRIIPTVESTDQALIELENAVAIAAEVRRGGTGTGNLDAFVTQVLDGLKGLTDQGRLDDASREADRAFAQWERDEVERRDAAQARGLALLDAGVRQDLLRRDPAAAAAKLARRVDLTTPVPAQRFGVLRAEWDEWYARGRDKGVNLDLAVSIELGHLSHARAASPDERCAALNDLGVALQTLGERESGTALLVEAVAAFRAALEECTRERAPLDWAMTQNNLGIVLQTLGARESGTTRLMEAAEAYRAALEEYTRERVPLDWAMTQNNLGAALWSLGERKSGTAHLEDAVEAYCAALGERTRERVPLDWAMTQNNLGNALQTLGERESGTARLVEAVEAYRAALEERTRERVPLAWATTQNNLGTALSILGKRESGTAHLEDAVEAYCAALGERTRERVPLDWAMTQNNLGNALLTLGERESGTARLVEAVEAYRAALEERTRERVPLAWATTQNNLGNALQTLGARESGTARLTEAVVAFRAALEERTRERVPLDWAMTQNNLGAALQTLGERESGTTRLMEAAEAYRAALEEYTRERVPLDWAMTTGNRASAWRLIAERTNDIALARRALDGLDEAARVSRGGGHEPQAVGFGKQAIFARALIARLESHPPPS